MFFSCRNAQKETPSLIYSILAGNNETDGIILIINSIIIRK